MNVVNYGTDPYGVEESALANRLRLAQMMQQQGMAGEGPPPFSTAATIAKALTGALGSYEQGQAEKGQRDLAARKDAGRKAELDAMFQQVGEPNDPKLKLARLLAGSDNPALAQAGMSMILKGPGKVSYQDAGDHISIRDESGHEVGQMPKGVTPDARYAKETVSADKKLDISTVPASVQFTQGKEDERQQRGLSTVPASARYTQGQENARFAAGQDKPQVVQGPNGEVMTVRPMSGTGANVVGPDGSPLSKGEKPLTETQGNAAAFGMRAKASNEIFNSLEAGGAPVGSITNMLAQNRITNAVAPAWAQQAQQAKLNFMSATLRKESGAAISQSEYDAEDRKYFPQPGDTTENIEQKRKARDLAIETMRVQAGQQGAKAIDKGGGGKSVVRTGTLNGRKVVQYSDGTADYAH